MFTTRRAISAARHGCVFFTLCTLLLSGSGCDSGIPAAAKKKELLIYCGITMIKPMREISDIVQAQENVTILITKGGSGNLMKSILLSQTGDLYLPGSERFYTLLEQQAPGTVKEKVFVGYNKAAMMVQKGNPRHITEDLANLTQKDLAVVIGNPRSGSIGAETKVILEKRGIYQNVLSNSMKLTTDSKDLVRVLKNQKADLVVNWYAVSTWPENRESIDVIEIAPEFAEKKRLILGLLRYSRHPEIARKIMELAASGRGRAIFKKYGLYFN